MCWDLSLPHQPELTSFVLAAAVHWGWCRCVSVSLFPGVAGPPGAPEGLLVTDTTDTTVQLSWGSGPDNHSPVTMYMVQARTPFSIGWQTVRTGNSCTIIHFFSIYASQQFNMWVCGPLADLTLFFRSFFFWFKTEKSWSVKVYDSAYYELKSCLGSGYQTTRNKLLKGSCCWSLLNVN